MEYRHNQGDVDPELQRQAELLRQRIDAEIASFLSLFWARNVVNLAIAYVYRSTRRGQHNSIVSSSWCHPGREGLGDPLANVRAEIDLWDRNEGATLRATALQKEATEAWLDSPDPIGLMLEGDKGAE